MAKKSKKKKQAKKAATANNGDGRANGLYRVRNSPIQGKGVFAAKRIRPGRRIIEYVGERIHPREELKRYPDHLMDRHHTFLFAVDEKTTIDAAVGGNDARFINHSCDPNCEAVDYDGHIWIEAIKNIQPGVELTYDYNFTSDSPPDEEDLTRYACRCGAEKCRGTIMKYEPPKKKRRKKNKKGKKERKK
ncbi:SET domain-containing protein-lysine N-methyltransferase [candidate division GN15 bacterium]|nr:SET domain-containing protein-lysine N-methyltransferase [candidate division GN15 bacterium]